MKVLMKTIIYTPFVLVAAWTWLIVLGIAMTFNLPLATFDWISKRK